MAQGWKVAALLWVGWLTGCTSYHAEPLDAEPHWPAGLNRLSLDPAQLPFHELARHPFRPEDGLDMTEVAMLAVSHNPDLQLARDDVGVAQAQAFDAGLLPDPQFAYSPQIPETSTPGSNVIAFDVSLGYDLSALVLHHARRAEADAHARHTDLLLLWQEWQVVGQARLLFVRIRAEEDSVALLEAGVTLATRLCDAEAHALQQGDIALPALSADRANLASLRQQLSDMTRQLAQNRAALNGLLGLAPETRLTLTGAEQLNVPDEATARARLSERAPQRPDLLALQAGYEAEDQRLRQAILGQFPAINVGLLKARDNNGTNYHGYAVSFNLPIFNRNRGAIAIETATRHRLHDEYQNRLQSAWQEIVTLLNDMALQQKALDQLQQALDEQDRLQGRNATALVEGTLDLAAYGTQEQVRLARRLDVVTAREALEEEKVALVTLIGGEFATGKAR